MTNIETLNLSSEKLQNLEKWLKNITPMVLAELQLIESSTAFDKYDLKQGFEPELNRKPKYIFWLNQNKKKITVRSPKL